MEFFWKAGEDTTHQYQVNPSIHSSAHALNHLPLLKRGMTRRFYDTVQILSSVIHRQNGGPSAQTDVVPNHHLRQQWISRPQTLGALTLPGKEAPIVVSAGPSMKKQGGAGQATEIVKQQSVGGAALLVCINHMAPPDTTKPPISWRLCQQSGWS